MTDQLLMFFRLVRWVVATGCRAVVSRTGGGRFEAHCARERAVRETNAHERRGRHRSSLEQLVRRHKAASGMPHWLSEVGKSLQKAALASITLLPTFPILAASFSSPRCS